MQIWEWKDRKEVVPREQVSWQFVRKERKEAQTRAVQWFRCELQVLEMRKSAANIHRSLARAVATDGWGPIFNNECKCGATSTQEDTIHRESLS